jgi:hypothetical protein
LIASTIAWRSGVRRPLRLPKLQASPGSAQRQVLVSRKPPSIDEIVEMKPTLVNFDK